MSKEREFLKKLRYASLLENDLRKELDELLAQPEQEPVGYLYKQMDCHGEWATIFKVDKPYITWHDIKDIVPVYTAPPKREPLSDGEITTNTPKTIPIGERLAFHAGIRWAEHKHTITGGGE